MLSTALSQDIRPLTTLQLKTCRKTCRIAQSFSSPKPPKLQYRYLNVQFSGSAAASSNASSSTSSSNSTPENAEHTAIISYSLSPGDLLLVQLGDERDLYLEITKIKKSSGSNGGSGNSSSDTSTRIIEALCEGETLQLSEISLNNTNPSPTTSITNITASHKGYWPRLSDAWVKRFPTLQAALKKARQLQEESETLPSQAITDHGIRNIHHLGSLTSFEAEVASNASFWCDGTGPGDPEPTSQQTALLTAGELSSFLNGLRGIALVQLDLPLDPETTLPMLPLLRPFVLRLMHRAAETKGVAVLPSILSGGLAASLVLLVKKQPFKAWGEHLAQTGVQASLVADSSFYKLLVGRILGYKEENVVHHITSYGGWLEPGVARAVDEELLKLSPVAPQLPWTSPTNTSSR